VGEYVEALKESDLRDGEMREITLCGRDLLLARVAGRFYAADDRCPHLGGHLSRGKLDGTTVICPRHHSRFDLQSGRALQWTDWRGWKVHLAQTLRPPRAVATYPVTVKDGRVLIEL
jgi:3-phenylpropionate/trans-cinnamate dioxygenase ferredoxin subunit